jgi:hypothetical protein
MSEASIAMKKTSGGDSPLWQDAGKSFWTLPISGVEGAASEVDQGGLTHRGHGQGLGRAALLCGRPVAPLHLLFGLLEALVNFWVFGFCFVQFREYFLCNFSETQKHQKIGNWHCGILLIG